MRRLAVVTSYFPFRNQLHRGHSAYQTLKELKKFVEIEVFCPCSRYPTWFQPRTFPYARPDPAFSPKDITSHYIEYPAVPLFSRPLNGPVSWRYLLPHLRRFAPDAILNYCIYPDGYAATRLARKLRIPAVLGAIGSDINRIPDPFTRLLTRRALQDAAMVLTVSEHLRNGVSRFSVEPERIRVISNGCDDSVFHVSSRTAARLELNVDPKSTLIVFVGSITATKGVRELLEALIRLLPSHLNLDLTLVGEGILATEIARGASQAGIAGHIRLAGKCDSSQVARWMAAANVFCLPSYAEGCPNVVIEALASGRPVVATNVGGIPELVDSESGLLVPPRNPEALAEALRLAIGRNWDDQAIAARVRRGWHQVARETYEVCREAITRREEHPSAFARLKAVRRVF